MALNLTLSAHGTARAIVVNLFIVGLLQMISVFFFGLMIYTVPIIVALITLGASLYFYKDAQRAVRRAAEKRLKELP
jgi:hypothetical protein